MEVVRLWLADAGLTRRPFVAHRPPPAKANLWGVFAVILFHREVLASAPLPRARSISVKVSGCPANPRELQR